MRWLHERAITKSCSAHTNQHGLQPSLPPPVPDAGENKKAHPGRKYYKIFINSFISSFLNRGLQQPTTRPTTFGANCCSTGRPSIAQPTHNTQPIAIAPISQHTTIAIAPISPELRKEGRDKERTSIELLDCLSSAPFLPCFHSHPRPCQLQPALELREHPRQ